MIRHKKFIKLIHEHNIHLGNRSFHISFYFYFNMHTIPTFIPQLFVFFKDKCKAVPVLN